MPRNEYVGGVAATTLASGVLVGATSVVVAAGTGANFPTAVSFPFPIVVDRGGSNEEVMLCTTRSSDVLTVTRAYDGTSDVAHDAGETVEHCIDATIINDASAHIVDTSAAHAASAISYAGGTGMSATDVEAAIDELATEKANDADVVHDTGTETIAGVKTFSSDPIIPDEAYGVGWNGSLEPPTKNAVYDKIETITTSSLSYQMISAAAFGIIQAGPTFAAVETNGVPGWWMADGADTYIAAMWTCPDGWTTADVEIHYSNSGTSANGVQMASKLVAFPAATDLGSLVGSGLQVSNVTPSATIGEKMETAPSTGRSVTPGDDYVVIVGRRPTSGAGNDTNAGAMVIHGVKMSKAS